MNFAIRQAIRASTASPASMGPTTTASSCAARSDAVPAAVSAAVRSPAGTRNAAPTASSTTSRTAPSAARLLALSPGVGCSRHVMLTMARSYFSRAHSRSVLLKCMPCFSPQLPRGLSILTRFGLALFFLRGFRIALRQQRRR